MISINRFLVWVVHAYDTLSWISYVFYEDYENYKFLDANKLQKEKIYSSHHFRRWVLTSLKLRYLRISWIALITGMYALTYNPLLALLIISISITTVYLSSKH